MIKNFLKNYLINKVIQAYEDGERFITSMINNYNKDNLKILDVGCGDGTVTKKILEPCNKKYTIYGLDLIDKNQVDKKIIYKKKFFDKTPFPYKSNSFDIVYSNQVIEHIIHKDQFIQECYRVLKKGGLCLFATENIASIDNIVSVTLGQEPIAQHTSSIYSSNSFLSPHFMEKYNNFDKNGYHMGHKNVSSYYGLLRLVKINGFKKAKMKSFGHINKFFEWLFPFQNRIIVAYSQK